MIRTFKKARLFYLLIISILIWIWIPLKFIRTNPCFWLRHLDSFHVTYQFASSIETKGRADVLGIDRQRGGVCSE